MGGGQKVIMLQENIAYDKLLEAENNGNRSGGMRCRGNIIQRYKMT